LFNDNLTFFGKIRCKGTKVQRNKVVAYLGTGWSILDACEAYIGKEGTGVRGWGPEGILTTVCTDFYGGRMGSGLVNLGLTGRKIVFSRNFTE
jgi:hypothetical protein